MTFMPWTDAWFAEIDAIDSDHEVIAADLRNLAAAARSTKAVAERLEQLARALDAHFGREERIMAAARYPYTEVHTQEHATVLDMVQAVRALYAARPERLDLPRVVEAIGVSVQNHVLRSDAVLIACLKGGCTVLRLVAVDDPVVAEALDDLRAPVIDADPLTATTERGPLAIPGGTDDLAKLTDLVAANATAARSGDAPGAVRRPGDPGSPATIDLDAAERLVAVVLG